MHSVAQILSAVDRLAKNADRSSCRRSDGRTRRLLVVAAAVTAAIVMAATAGQSALAATPAAHASTAAPSLVVAGKQVASAVAEQRSTQTPAEKQAAAKKKAEDAKHHAQSAARWSLLLAVLALLILLPLGLWLIELLVKWFKPSSSVLMGWSWIKGAVVGTDKRLSTSKTVMAVWTYSLASVLLAIVIAKLLGHPEGLDALKKSGLQAEYAVLIGGPIGAAILAKGIVSSQVSSGQSKPDGDEAKAADLVSNDTGQTDLGDLQYVLFNTVALVFFFGQFLADPLLGLPDMPDVLVGLTSVSAVGYLGKKALPASMRAIAEVRPSPVAATAWTGGTPVKFTALGSGLVNADKSAPIQVRFENDAGGEDASNVVASITSEGTTLAFDLATALPVGTYALHVVTREGNKITKADALTVT
jgi:hypothetical protein